jgi:hypothetical protein
MWGASVNTSENVNEIAAALAKAQGAVLGAKKDADNPFFKSKYADLASVVDAIRKAFADNCLSYVQTPCTNEKDEVGVETLLMHSSGQWIKGESFYVPVTKHDAQGFGSALTYTRRYALAAMAGVAQVDDDGNAAAATKPLKPAFAAAHTARDTAVDEYNRMTPEEQQWAREQALELIALHDDGKDMYRWKETQNWSAEEFMAIWSQLPSHVRTKFKKQKVDALSKPLAAELASQP